MDFRLRVGDGVAGTLRKVDPGTTLRDFVKLALDAVAVQSPQLWTAAAAPGDGGGGGGPPTCPAEVAMFVFDPRATLLLVKGQPFQTVAQLNVPRRSTLLLRRCEPGQGSIDVVVGGGSAGAGGSGHGEESPPPRKRVTGIGDIDDGGGEGADAERRREGHERQPSGDAAESKQPAPSPAGAAVAGPADAAPLLPSPAASSVGDAAEGDSAPPPPPSSSAAESPAPAVPGANEWACPACTFHNEVSDLVCSVCGAQRPAPARAPAPAPSPSSSASAGGEWACSSCTLSNPATNRWCSLCEAPRPAAVAPAAISCAATPPTSVQDELDAALGLLLQEGHDAGGTGGAGASAGAGEAPATPPTNAQEQLPRMQALATETIARCTAPVDMTRFALRAHHVPADNSCLFAAMSCILFGDRRYHAALRELVAQAVLGNPVKYSHAILGRAPVAYVQFIRDPLKWGGDIEISIFHDFFDLDVCVANIAANTLIGLNDGPPSSLPASSSAGAAVGGGGRLRRRVYLLYDGIHYDALVCTTPASADAGGRVDQSVFLRDDVDVERAVRQLTAELHQRRKFTNVNATDGSFQLQCLVCKTGLRDTTHAQAHARQTGHVEFGQTQSAR